MEDIARTLSTQEKRVLSAIKEERNHVEIAAELAEEQISVLRSLTYLEQKGLLETKRVELESIELGNNGELYKEEGLPELQILSYVEANKSATLNELKQEFSADEVNASIGKLKRYDAVNLRKKGDETVMEPTEHAATLHESYEPQKFLQKTFPVSSENLSETEKEVFEELLSRKGLVEKQKTKLILAERTKDGNEILSSEAFKTEYHDHITPSDIEQGAWKNKEYRHFDMETPEQPLRIGRKHFVREAISRIKDIWVEIGFEEMHGKHVQSAFWDLDALYVPQDHPARDMQDTFYLDRKTSVPETVYESVKAVHERGGSTGSKGWQKPFRKDISEQTLLRTHTTVLSALKFYELQKEDLPKKYFSVAKVFRNEALDWKHLMEFHQVEGIVVDPEGSLSKLIGYIKDFLNKLGYEDLRIRPGYFPYTEPSAEVDVYNESKQEWVEIAGAGIMRSEVTTPLLGFDCPVLAWGMGLERIITTEYNVEDLRSLYNNDVEDLQRKQLFSL